MSDNENLTNEVLEHFSREVFGFNNLTTMAQGVLVGYFNARETWPVTYNMEETLQLARKAFDQTFLLTDAWGFQK